MSFDIEHRLFAFIRQNWRGKPLLTHQAIVQLIASTTTCTGLTVQCRLDEKTYEKGTKVSDAQIASSTSRQPLKPTGNQTVIGTLLGAMHDCGQVLHYRVDLRDKTVLLAPSAWLHPDSRWRVAVAGLALTPEAGSAPSLWAPMFNAMADRERARQAEQESVA